jgi:hypothetical protein
MMSVIMLDIRLYFVDYIWYWLVMVDNSTRP